MKVHEVYNFTPRVVRFAIIVLVVGGIDLFHRQLPSKVNTEKVADKISNFANVLKDIANRVLVLGIPPGHNQNEQTTAVDKLLFNRIDYWAYRGVENLNLQSHSINESHLLLNHESIRSICFILKPKNVEVLLPLNWINKGIQEFTSALDVVIVVPGNNQGSRKDYVVRRKSRNRSALNLDVE